MSDILILSKKNTDELLIADKLKKHFDFKIEIANSAKEAAERIKQHPFELVIFNLKKFDHDKFKMAKNLRQMGHHFPMMALAPEVDFNILLQIEALPSTVLLEKPYEDKDLLGLAQKLIDGKDVYQRIHRRYLTNQIANLEIYPSGENLQTHIFNMSQGGAYIEAPQDASFRAGDLVKLDVPLKRINRKHNVHAKVVWTDKNAIWNCGQSIGIEFIKDDEVYTHMLANI